MVEHGGRKTTLLQGPGDHLGQPGPTGWCLAGPQPLDFVLIVRGWRLEMVVVSVGTGVF